MGRRRRALVERAAVVAAVAFFASIPSARSAEGLGAYLKPSIGHSWLTIKTLEIEKTFISAPLDPDTGEVDEEAAEQLAMSAARRPVGRKAFYEGSGMSYGVAGGLRLYSLWIGVDYSWIPARLHGYSKRYRYDPEKLRARGRKFYDEATVDFQRVLCELKYGFPIGRFELQFRTRFGGVFIDEGALVMGRSVDQGAGFTGDVGAGLSFAPLGWLSVSATGFAGMNAFTGVYHGAYGSIGGLDISLVAHI